MQMAGIRADEAGLTLVAQRDGETVLVLVGGVLDMATAGLLETRAQTEMGPATTVVVDLSGVRLVDSTGMGCLVRLHRHAQLVGAQFALRGPRGHVADVLAMTGISRVLTVVPEELA
jgi:anti-anti-sigma factor